MNILLLGNAGAGKDTVAEALGSDYHNIKFATALRELAVKTSTLNMEQLTEPDLKDAPTKYTVDYGFLASYVGGLEDIQAPNNLQTPRDYLNWLGTGVLRKKDPEWHIRQTSEQIHSDNNVFTDCRFVNEFELVANLFGDNLTVLVIRDRNGTMPCEFEMMDIMVKLGWYALAAEYDLNVKIIDNHYSTAKEFQQAALSILET